MRKGELKEGGSRIAIKNEGGQKIEGGKDRGALRLRRGRKRSASLVEHLSF